MIKNSSYVVKVLVLLLLTVQFGCGGRVPVEVVELSYTVGEDIDALHRSYRALIETHFDSLRRQVETFLQARWLPIFIKDFAGRAKLADIIANEENPGAGARLNDWAAAAVEIVIRKRDELFGPIAGDEKELLKMVDDAFALLLRANGKISAHLNSLRKVRPVEEQESQKPDIKELRQKIDKGLLDASGRVMKNIEQSGKTGRQARASEEKDDEPGRE